MSSETSNNAWHELSRSLEERAKYLERALKEFIINLTSSNYENVVNGNRTVIMYFTAEWCGPCINFYKTFKDVAAELLSPGVAFAKVDVDSAYSIADKYQVRHIPTILIVVDGKVVDSVVGQTSREELAKKLRKYVLTSSAS